MGTPSAGSRRALVHHDAHEIDGVLGAKLAHDTATMDLDRARAYPQISGGFLVGGRSGDLCQYLALATRQLMVARNRGGRGGGDEMLRCRWSVHSSMA